MRILIAEDDATSRLLLEKTLGQWGYEVTVTKDGDEAWDVTERRGSKLSSTGLDDAQHRRN